MISQFASLASGSLSRNPLRTLFLLLTIVGTMFAFVGTEAATRELSMSTMNMWNAQSYDLAVTGAGAFSISKPVGGMAGVRGTEDVYLMPAIVNGNAGQVLVTEEGRMINPKYASGGKPQADYEIAVGGFIAERDALDIGSDIRLSRTNGDEEAVVYTVSGIVSSPPSLCIMTKEGLTRLEPSPEQYQTVLVARDASIDVTKTRERIRQVIEGTGMKVHDYGESQVMVDSRVYAITSVTSGLVLISGMSSFLILLGLYQRDRSYELGVLRALGYSKIAVFLVLSLDALSLIAMGLLIGLLGSIAGTYLFHLGNLSTLLARNGEAMWEVGWVSVLLAVVTSYRSSNSPVMRLLSIEPGLLPGSNAGLGESRSRFGRRYRLFAMAILGLAVCFIVVKVTVMRGGDSVGLKAYDDVRVVHGTAWAVDVSNMNLTRAGSIIPTLTFNEATKWPERMPKGCDPRKIMEDAKNPGLGIRALHGQGLTGEGVAVAIIDQPLYQDHPEFVGKIAMYKDFGCESESSMHGPAVTSLLVGENCGTAPGASVYYAAAPSWHADATYYADALDWLVSVSKELPEGQKIRVVSVSAILSGEGSEFENGDAWDEAVANAEKEGILVLDGTREDVHGIIAPCHYDPADLRNPVNSTT